jgi:hypothetical protein
MFDRDGSRNLGGFRDHAGVIETNVEVVMQIAEQDTDIQSTSGRFRRR